MSRRLATSHAARIERRIEQVVGDRGPHERQARVVEALADAGEDLDLAGACQRRADDPVSDSVSVSRIHDDRSLRHRVGVI